MALIRMDHISETVKVNMPVNILLPDLGYLGEVPLRDRKVLYLLHGLGDDASAWQRFSSVENLARLYGLVVVMPSGWRSFYTDLPNGQGYFTYLMEELPAYLSALFGLAPRREDTLIAGLSMGGYGAFKAALLHPERFYAAASFSGFLSLDFLRLYPNDPRRAEFATLFGDLEKLSGSEHDPLVWLKQASQNPQTLPRLFIANGRQDDLYPLSLHFHRACQALGVRVDYHEEDAKHDWFFWDKEIGRFLSAILDEG